MAAGKRTEVRVAERARIVLLAASHLRNDEIGVELDIDRRTAALWRNRYLQHGLKGILKDLPRGGRKPIRRDQLASKIIRKTTQAKPTAATHWTVRTMAQEVGASPAMVHRVWKIAGLKPHQSRPFKLSNDPQFEEKLIDVVVLYLNPPEHALVICADEKTQIQALDRTQPGLPLKKGRCGTMTLKTAVAVLSPAGD